MGATRKRSNLQLGTTALYTTWGLALVLSFVAPVMGFQAVIERGYPLGRALIWAGASFLFVATAIFSGLKGRPPRLAVLLSLSLLCVTATNFIAEPFWRILVPTWFSGAPSPASAMLLQHAISNTGWMGLVAALLLFPSGQFDSRGARFVFCSAFAYFLADAILQSAGTRGWWAGFPALIGFALVFAGTLAVLVARLRRVGSGPQRQQLDWLFAGIFAGIICIIAPLWMVTVAELLGLSGNAYELFLSGMGYFMPLGFYLFVAALVMALWGLGLSKGSYLARVSAASSVLILFATVVFVLLDLLLKEYASALMGADAARATAVLLGLVSAHFLKPVQKRISRGVRRWLDPAEGARSPGAAGTAAGHPVPPPAQPA